MTTITPLILNESEAAKMLRLSPRTMQRLRLDGGGPTFVRLTAHRIGYRISDLDAWTIQRLAASTSSPATTGRRIAP
jgi:predicted DNA-binding transcriptional regulator AlpA